VLALLLAGCGEGGAPYEARRVVGGDPDIGRTIVADARYGCGACHAIPGIPNARGTVGPSLAGFGARGYIAGQIPNMPGRLVAWLEDPPALVPATAMPDVGLDEARARHAAAWLYTLRDPRGGSWGVFR
jgi:cytochrome c